VLKVSIPRSKDKFNYNLDLTGNLQIAIFTKMNNFVHTKSSKTSKEVINGETRLKQRKVAEKIDFLCSLKMNFG